ncbi:helix-turn-helix domain-containing protein [Enterococcus mediterraneensis]|uniref:helix-turn-helix domain-containing protein n=1 Tax=Enterococcus mediterraneensis TaxID=2364791 RepID=UPI000F05A99A|nr:AraC family transcriptional regulator [Enterococcus mediterraneensis]
MRYVFNRKDPTLPLVIDSVGTHWEQEPIKRPQGYPYIHWLHTQEGAGSVTINGETFILEKNTSILINRDIPHEYVQLSEQWITAYFTFGGALAAEILALLGIADYLVLDKPLPELNQFIEHLAAAIDADDPAASLKTSGMIYSFLMLIKEVTVTHPRKNQRRLLIQPLIQYMNINYAKPIRNEELAKLVGYSPQYVSKIFKECYQLSPYQYLLELRLRKAKELLVNEPLLSIQEVSEQVGFNDVSYFIAAFKHSEQMTPRKFRQFYYG